MKVLVLGSGAREDCLVWKISQSKYIDKVFCAPGNGGTVLRASNVNISERDFDSLAAFVKKENIELTIVGPEVPLALGIVDYFNQKGLRIFGPNKQASSLEASKIFAKEFMYEFGIPTAGFKVFSDSSQALSYIKKCSFPLVIKADGLAAGKGVVVADNLAEAAKAVEEMMLQKRFKDAGNRIIVEDFLEGEEASLLAFVDGRNFVLLVSSQDHKRVYDGDKGPNTGGMGAYSPAPVVTAQVIEKVKEKVFSPLLKGFRKRGIEYKGIVYAGLMIKKGNPYVLEFNVRFGDPETQVILPRLKTDLADIMLKTIAGKLDEVSLDWEDKSYPLSYEKGKVIKGLEQLDVLEDIFVFHAGTKISEDNLLVTSGGRVLTICAMGPDIKQARQKAYDALGKVYFEGMHFRRDIGIKALQK